MSEQNSYISRTGCMTKTPERVEGNSTAVRPRSACPRASLPPEMTWIHLWTRVMRCQCLSECLLVSSGLNSVLCIFLSLSRSLSLSLSLSLMSRPGIMSLSAWKSLWASSFWRTARLGSQQRHFCSFNESFNIALKSKKQKSVKCTLDPKLEVLEVKGSEMLLSCEHLKLLALPAESFMHR